MSVNTKMTAIANEIRELSGTTDTMGLDTMANYVGEANSEIGGQEDLIAQIASALEEKAAGGGSTTIDDVSKKIIDGTITNVEDNDVKIIRGYAFYKCSSLTSINFPVCTSIGNGAFQYCSSLALINFPACTTIDNGAFQYCSSLTSINFPVCTNINYNAFRDCISLTSINFPACTTISSTAFYYCSRLTSVSFPVCTYIGNNAFRGCYSLTSVSFPLCRAIGSFAFGDCYNLSSLTLGASTVCTLSNSSAFLSTPYTGRSTSFSGTPYIYVPASLVDAYKSATNWVYFSSYFSSIESLGGNLITFAIDGTVYQAEEGMTWEEWVNSKYNSDGYSTTMFGQIANNSGNYVCYKNGLSVGDSVSASEIIIFEIEYVTD